MRALLHGDRPQIGLYSGQVERLDEDGGGPQADRVSLRTDRIVGHHGERRSREARSQDREARPIGARGVAVHEYDRRLGQAPARRMPRRRHVGDGNRSIPRIAGGLRERPAQQVVALDDQHQRCGEFSAGCGILRHHPGIPPIGVRSRIRLRSSHVPGFDPARASLALAHDGSSSAPHGGRCAAALACGSKGKQSALQRRGALAHEGVQEVRARKLVVLREESAPPPQPRTWPPALQALTRAALLLL